MPLAPFDDSILPEFPVEGHTGPVELLGGLAHVPLGGEESGEHTLSLALGEAFSLREPLAEWLRQVHERDPAGGKVDAGGFEEVLQLADVARPVVVEQEG